MTCRSPVDLLRVALVVCWVLVIGGTVHAQPGPPRDQDPPRTPYDKLLDHESAQAVIDAAKAAGIVHEIQGQVDEGDEAGQFVHKMLDEAFGFGALGDPRERLEHIEYRRAAFHNAQATDADITGLGHLIAGRFEEAVAQLRVSHRADPARGLPALFEGVALIELGRWRDAVRPLAEAEKDERCLPTATLLRAWAEQCAVEPPANDAEAGLRLIQAMSELPPVELNFARAISGRLHYNESDAIYWAQGAAYNFSYNQLIEQLEVKPDPQSPHASLARLLAFAPSTQIDDALKGLLDQFPDDPALNEHRVWRRYQAMDDDELKEAWPQVQAWVDMQLKRDPDNGIYHLMRVLPVHDFEDVEREDGTLDYIDLGKPYTDEELAAMRRFIEAPRLDHPGNRMQAQALALRYSVLGGFAQRNNMSSMGYPWSWLRRIARRYENTFAQRIEAGEQAQAIEMGELLVSVVRRTRGISSSDPTLVVLVANSIEALVAQTWIDHASETGDPALMQRGIEHWIATQRYSRGMAAMVNSFTVGEVLPVLRMRRVVNALCMVSELTEESPFYQAYLIDRRSKGPEWIAEQMEELRVQIDHPEDGYGADRAILALTDLRHDAALPLFKKLQADPDPFIAALADWAVGQYEVGD